MTDRHYWLNNSFLWLLKSISHYSTFQLEAYLLKSKLKQAYVQPLEDKIVT